MPSFLCHGYLDVDLSDLGEKRLNAGIYAGICVEESSRNTSCRKSFYVRSVRR